MAISGMDIAQVRSLAVDMRHRADEIRAIATRLTGQLQSTPWTGRDHDRFLHDWQSQHLRALTMAATSISEAAAAAGREADQQEQASS